MIRIYFWRRNFRTNLLLTKLMMAAMCLGSPVMAGDGNRFVWAQLQYDGDWNPYPGVAAIVQDMVRTMTNIPLSASTRFLKLSDPKIFEFPILLVKGNARLQFSSEEKANLKSYIERGGFVFFDDTLADRQSAFAQSIRSILEEIFPSWSLRPLQADHAVYRSFFLLRKGAGRRMEGRFLEGLDLEGNSGGERRTAVIYCPFDLLGAWVKDPMGKYAFACEPGGEAQRWEAFKLTINVIYFSLTGTYKKDAVHQPFIERKLEGQ